MNEINDKLPDDGGSGVHESGGGEKMSGASQTPMAETAAYFKPDKKDSVFALLAFVLGYLFCRWVLTSGFGWVVAVFTTVYLGMVLIYLCVKGVRLPAESWFWFGVTLLTGISFALWDNIGLMGLRSLFLFCSAVYWVISATASQIKGCTGNLLLLDGVNAVFVIPFRNFPNQYRSLGALKSGTENRRKKVLPVLLGIVLAIIILLVVTPQLLKADSGGFSTLLEGLLAKLRIDWIKVAEFAFYAFLAIPTAAYLFGLVSGCVARKGTNAFMPDKTESVIASFKILAPTTVNIVLVAVCGLYAVFISCQLPYYFSAFSGSTPMGWLSYSDYARQGFFELCRIAAINLLLLAALNILCKKPRPENKLLRIFNALLALITLLLISTAFSKMALYINTFGLTIPRVLPSVFMVFLAVISIGVIVMQKKAFSIVRVSLIAGSVLFCALCLVDADGFVVRYNTERYLAGTLTEYDTGILYRSGSAGVPFAAEVYYETTDLNLKNKIREYLVSQKEQTLVYKGTYCDTLQKEQALEMLGDLDLGQPR